jgi:glycosyltransferase involved in cell wall biosynthesis
MSKPDENHMHVGVIASMKRGLEHFIYREITLLEGLGASISIFPTKCGPGLYHPRPTWHLHRWSALGALLWQPYFFVRRPLQYARLLAHALAMSALMDFFVAWRLSRSMASIDVLYATFGDHKLFIGYFCKLILGKPLVVAIHAYELYQNPNPPLFVEALRHCDQIITVTEHNRQWLAEHFLIDPSAVEVVRLSVDLADYRPAAKFVVLIVAFFAERKGHETLLRAVKELGDESIEVWVVGDEGPEDRVVDVRRLAAELGLASQVAFFGALSGAALKAVYRACDVVCLPCRFDNHGVGEGFPTVIIEAMALGKPVIATRHVEIPRILEEILVDENDVHGLAEAIQRAKQCVSLREQLGRQNRAIAERVFSPRNVEMTARILRSVAGRDGGPAPRSPSRCSDPAPPARRDRLSNSAANHPCH